MTRATIDNFYAPISGYAYLGEQRLRDVAEATGAEIRYRPVDIARVFAATETTPPFKQSAARLSYRIEDMKRSAAIAGLTVKATPKYWPAPTDLACRLITAASRLYLDVGKLSFATLRAVWAEELNVADEATMRMLAAREGFDAAALFAEADSLATRTEAEGHTAAAIDAQVFGSPTYVFNGERFFGQDRLDMLAAALRKAEAA